MYRRILMSLSSVLLVIPLFPGGAGATQARTSPSLPISDIKDTTPDLNDGKPLKFARGTRSDAARLAPQARAARRGRNRVGAVRPWLGLDDFNGEVYLKNYKLRGKGEHIEVWVANDQDLVSKKLKFPYSDCRNDGIRSRVTDQQIRRFIRKFDNNIYPKESRVFSVPPRRNGRSASLPGFVELPARTYRGGKGGGDNVVVLVDNVRDDNFYDPDNQSNLTYIAGFFSSQFNELFDRNVMTIDGWDWLHRTGANPPNEPNPNDLCTSAPARAFLYEGVFAHEYQHLLEYYEDPGETLWINEGLSDWAQTLTGYVDPTRPITDLDFDGHIQCFLGFLGVQTPANPNPRDGGPENSLTLWEDQGAGEILCDYGAAYTMMEYLHGLYGNSFMRALHRDDATGLDSLAALLEAASPGTTVDETVHKWAAMVALDGVLDDGAALTGGTAGDYQVPTLDATINWDTPNTHNSPGAPPNGSDYVRLRAGDGTFFGAGDLTSLSFDGAQTLEPKPVEWAVDSDPPNHPADPALFSGAGDDFDRAIAQVVSVPAGTPTLTFDTQFVIEDFFDYGFVQVSTDGGRTSTSLANENTIDVADPTALPSVHENLPGFTGDSGGWRTETFDLTPYAGQDIVLAFRYITDQLVTEDGWWIDNVAVGGTSLSDGTTLAGWQTPSQIAPIEVSGFTVQLVAYDDAHTGAWIAEVPLDAAFDGTLSATELNAALGTTAEVVGAIVTYDEPTELVTDYAPYVLTVNGVVQPGG